MVIKLLKHQKPAALTQSFCFTIKLSIETLKDEMIRLTVCCCVSVSHSSRLELVLTVVSLQLLTLTLLHEGQGCAATCWSRCGTTHLTVTPLSLPVNMRPWFSVHLCYGSMKHTSVMLAMSCFVFYCEEKKKLQRVKGTEEEPAGCLHQMNESHTNIYRLIHLVAPPLPLLLPLTHH